jgi:methionyl-tRNA formyltransferase
VGQALRRLIVRLAFMGTPEFAVPSLEVLLERPGELVAVYTQPDRKKGRGLALSASPVKERALQAGVTVHQPPSLKDGAAFAAFAALDLDLCVVAAYGRILPARWLGAPRLGCINVHASLLPRYRGAAPVEWAIARGETVTGVTLMQMDAGMDTGGILMQRSLPIDPGDTGGTLEDKLARLGAELLRQGLARLREGPLPRTPQDPALATMAPALRKEDGRIDWARPARELADHVRAMDPWPGAFTTHEGRLLKVFRAMSLPLGEAAPPGRVTRVERGGAGRLEVAAGEGALALLEVQAEGKKRLPVREFLAGYRIREGDLFT